jgi:hypothetical protein
MHNPTENTMEEHGAQTRDNNSSRLPPLPGIEPTPQANTKLIGSPTAHLAITRSDESPVYQALSYT